MRGSGAYLVLRGVSGAPIAWEASGLFHCAAPGPSGCPICEIPCKQRESIQVANARNRLSDNARACSHFQEQNHRILRTLEIRLWVSRNGELTFFSGRRSGAAACRRYSPGTSACVSA